MSSAGTAFGFEFHVRTNLQSATESHSASVESVDNFFDSLQILLNQQDVRAFANLSEFAKRDTRALQH